MKIPRCILRRRSLIFTLLFFWASSQILQAVAPEPTNFLIVLCDDLGYGDLSCYENSTIQTPNLDRLASQGARLTDCYAAAPVCSPSRVGLLTGRTPSRIGIYDWIPDNHPMHLQASEITIASLLRASGYETCHVGKWHCTGRFNSSDQPQPGDHGFDYWFSTANNAVPSHRNPSNFVRNGQPVGELTGYSCQIVVDEAIHWLREVRSSKKPFFLFVCFHEPHEPIASPPDLMKLYSHATPGQAEYFANVTNMDRAVGRLMKALDESSLDENTLVFFTSDNGPETLKRYPGAARSHGSTGPLRGRKLHLYEGGIRVPGILRWPGRIESGLVIDEPVSGLDVLPTLCELAGVGIPKDRVLDGASFVPVFDGNPVERSTPLFWHYFRSIGQPKAAMRMGTWSILGHWDGPDLGPGGSVHPGDMEIIKSANLTAFELFDLSRDLSQSSNLAKVAGERLETMAKELKRKYNEVQKEGPFWQVTEPWNARKQKR